MYSEDDQSEDEEVFPMKDRNFKPALPRKVEVINIQIQSDDSLQALALRYHCTVSDGLSISQQFFIFGCI